MRKTLALSLVVATTLAPTMASAGTEAVARPGAVHPEGGGRPTPAAGTRPRGAEGASARTDAAARIAIARTTPRRPASTVRRIARRFASDARTFFGVAPAPRMAPGEAMMMDAPLVATAAEVATLNKLLMLPTAAQLRDKALMPDVFGPLAIPGVVAPPPTPGFVQLIDGSQAPSRSRLAPQAFRALAREKSDLAGMGEKAMMRVRAMQKDRPRTVFIDGGGPSGALSAIHAFKLGFDVTIVEPRAQNTLPIVWNNRPQTRDILRLIDPSLERKLFANFEDGTGLAGKSYAGEYLQDGKAPVKASPDRNTAINVRTAPDAVTNEPRTIASTPSTYQTQARSEVELYWQELSELAQTPQGKSRLHLLRGGYQVVALPVEGDRRGVVIQKFADGIQRVDAAGQPILENGAPITRPLPAGQAIPEGWAKASIPAGERQLIHAPDDLIDAEGSNSRTRALAGAENIEVGPATRYIAGFIKNRRITSEPAPADGRVVTGGVIRRVLKLTDDKKALRHIAISAANLQGTWALPEIDGRLDFEDPASIKKYFGEELTKKAAIERYYIREIAPMLGVKPEELSAADFEFGPGPFVLQSHVSGHSGANTENFICVGDCAGNSHFLTSLGKVTGTGTHQLSLRHYWNQITAGANPKVQRALLARRINEGTRTWIKAGLREFDEAGGGNLGAAAQRAIGEANGNMHFEAQGTAGEAYQGTNDPTQR